MGCYPVHQRDEVPGELPVRPEATARLAHVIRYITSGMAGRHTGMHARLGRSRQARTTPPIRPVRGRPWKRRRCTPTVRTVHTDRSNSTDARPLYVRGQRTTTVYSA